MTAGIFSAPPAGTWSTYLELCLPTVSVSSVDPWPAPVDAASGGGALTVVVVLPAAELLVAASLGSGEPEQPATTVTNAASAPPIRAVEYLLK
ncbi:hypothetical protein HLB23_13880 [Nocardia uniformis]|uniref:Uncharacterized protein n=1 Tax=Nocardia uniformis TaxID=53432 RepID=A0A849C548_9NOCA|nr:hypothetical protein [Nocardia uniformis]NNH70937.1 hypothetical protein [Nocardia uniformis]